MNWVKSTDYLSFLKEEMRKIKTILEVISHFYNFFFLLPALNRNFQDNF